MFWGLLFFWGGGGGQLCANLFKKIWFYNTFREDKLSFHIKNFVKDGRILLLFLKKKDYLMLLTLVVPATHFVRGRENPHRGQTGREGQCG